jgi:hypothetical protein
MKKLILSLSIAAVGVTGLPSTASAQRYDERPLIEARVDGPRISIGRGDDDRGGGWGRGRAAVAHDLNRLNREVRQVSHEIRAAGGGGPRVRVMFRDVVRRTERLNDRFERRAGNPWEIRRRAEELRDQLQEIRRELRYRGIRRGGDWR